MSQNIIKIAAAGVIITKTYDFSLNLGYMVKINILRINFVIYS